MTGPDIDSSTEITRMIMSEHEVQQLSSSTVYTLGRNKRPINSISVSQSVLESKKMLFSHRANGCTRT